MARPATGRWWCRLMTKGPKDQRTKRHFYRTFFTIFSGNPRFRQIFLSYSTWFFEKYAAFGALLIYLFDFFVFCKFWPRFGALLMALWNFVDVFSLIFSVVSEFRWFWKDLTQIWCVLPMCLVFSPFIFRESAMLTVQKSVRNIVNSIYLGHLYVACCKIHCFSCPERFWPRSSRKM